jgi:putative nucleotide binding protein
MTDPGDETGGSGGSDDPREAVVLDYLPTGLPDEQRSNTPVAYALGVDEFELYLVRFEGDTDLNVGDRVSVDPRGESVSRVGRIDYEELSGAAESELEYAVAAIIDADERRFVDFFNEAQAITTRLHALNLLPGIGKKLRNNVLDLRKRQPFESFDDLEERVSGLHDPRQVLIDRIVEEIGEEDMKYRIFATRKRAE